jgi:hypothetical protein
MVPFLHLPDDHVFQPHEIGCGPSPGEIFTEVTGMTIQSLYPPAHHARAIPTRARKGSSELTGAEPRAGGADFQQIFTPGMQGAHERGQHDSRLTVSGDATLSGRETDKPRRPEDITTRMEM